MIKACLLRTFFLLIFCQNFFANAASIAETIKNSKTESDEFLSVDEAFPLNVIIIDNDVVVRFKIADNYYLYRDKFSISSKQAHFDSIQFPDAELKHDEFLGEQYVYHRFVEWRATLTDAPTQFDVAIHFQGCAEKGLCYPPTKRQFSLTKNTDAVDDEATASDPSLLSGNEKKPNTSVNVAAGEDLTQLIGGNLLLAFFVAIAVGMGLTFTPCVLPMIPITLGIIGAQGTQLPKSRVILLVLVYVQAMALSYALLGVAVASAGAALQGYLQNPWIISMSATLFVVLAFAMFGAYELQLPSSWQEKIMDGSSKQNGNIMSVAVMGALSALIVSPCVSAPLAGALMYIAQTGEELRGAIALYGLGLGMGVPLFIAGVGGARLLPKAGVWMDKVKHVFGFGLLAVAITLLNRLLPGSIALALWGFLAIAFAQFFAHLTIDNAWHYFVRALHWTLLLTGMVYLIGAFNGNDDPLRPLHGTVMISTNDKDMLDPHALFKPVKSVADVQREVNTATAQGKTVLLDFFADWCVACFEFAKYTFPNSAVQQQLKNTVLLQADVTANDEVDRALLEHFAIKGLPSILLFNKHGEELTHQRVTGFLSASDFSLHIKNNLD